MFSYNVTVALVCEINITPVPKEPKKGRVEMWHFLNNLYIHILVFSYPSELIFADNIIVGRKLSLLADFLSNTGKDDFMHYTKY